jgi:hypothetical protein
VSKATLPGARRCPCGSRPSYHLPTEFRQPAVPPGYRARCNLAGGHQLRADLLTKVLLARAAALPTVPSSPFFA